MPGPWLIPPRRRSSPRPKRWLAGEELRTVPRRWRPQCARIPSRRLGLARGRLNRAHEPSPRIAQRLRRLSQSHAVVGYIPSTRARHPRIGGSPGAFQLNREDPRVRDRYGRHIHGQCLLLARRLVETGVGLVTVNWHDDHQNFWDTHGDNFNQLKNRLMRPPIKGSRRCSKTSTLGLAERNPGGLGR